jgi:MFS family permease
MSSPARRRGGLWRQRDFGLFWTGETTSEAGSAVTFVALPLVAVESLHAGTFAVTVLTAATWLPWLVIGVPAGAWVDRLPARPVMLTCDVISLAAFASVPFAAWSGVLSVAQLIAVALLAGAASVLFTTAYQVLLPGIVDEADLTEGNAKLEGSRSAAQIGGPGLGGALAQLAGPATGLLADAASFAVSFACLAALRSPRDHRQATTVRSGTCLTQDALRGLRFVRTDPYLRAQAAFAAAANLTLTGVDSLIVVFLTRTIRLPGAVVGLTVAAFGIGGVLGALAARPLGQRFGTSRAILIAAIGCLPFGLLLPLTQAGPGIAFAVTANLVTSAGVVASNIIARSFCQTYVPAGMLGRVSSAIKTAAFATMPVGSLLAGLLATTVGIRETLWLLTAGTSACGLIFLLSPMRRLRDLPRRPPAPVRDVTATSSSSLRAARYVCGGAVCGGAVCGWRRYVRLALRAGRLRRVPLGRNIEQAQRVSLGGGFGPSGGAQLGENVGHVDAGGLGGDEQGGRDLPV